MLFSPNSVGELILFSFSDIFLSFFFSPLFYKKESLLSSRHKTELAPLFHLAVYHLNAATLQQTDAVGIVVEVTIYNSLYAGLNNQF